MGMEQGTSIFRDTLTTQGHNSEDYNNMPQKDEHLYCHYFSLYNDLSVLIKLYLN